jgi:hypothetical protein
MVAVGIAVLVQATFSVANCMYLLLCCSCAVVVLYQATSMANRLYSSYYDYFSFIRHVVCALPGFSMPICVWQTLCTLSHHCLDALLLGLILGRSHRPEDSRAGIRGAAR